ncbi:3'-5' exonuclease [Deefgea piscis]|uniref:3'-5' exonuclease n=1 Tax=Deefgea piscis TaxID=2739061 RepID=A0A6M8SQY6_9NEIS|nr:3'-5' exonuclease [Deefgea piscis]QKJ65269.1 3'-5' exonuclease [Deefgea piscis]
MKTFYLDTETTGLNRNGEDEIVEIAIIDQDGEIILHSLLRPTAHTAWPEAEAIHCITPGMVATSPTLEQITPRLNAALSQCDGLVIYNLDYDWSFLPQLVCQSLFDRNVRLFCAMHRFAAYNGVWDEKRGDYKWQKLTVAAERFGHVWEGQAHRALADCYATKTVWECLQNASCKRYSFDVESEGGEI